jgi:hypothetical protein
MATTVFYTATPGGVYYAFPVNQSLDDWTTYRIPMAAATAPNEGRYSATLDESSSLEWHIFAGSTQPSAWDEGEAIIDITNIEGEGFTDAEKSQILSALSLDADIGVPTALTFRVVRKDGELKVTAAVPKDVDEEVDIAVDFRDIIAAGDAINPDNGLVAIALVDDGNEDVIEFEDQSQAEIFMSTVVKIGVSGGTAGQTDRLRVTVLTVGGHTHSVICPVKVTGE